MTAPKTPPLFSRAFVTLSLVDLAYFTGAGLMIPVVPLYASGPLGADEAGVGLVVGAFSVTALVMRPYAGRLADSRGRRPLLVGGALVFSLVVAAHLLAPGLLMLAGLRLLLGAAEAFFFVAGFAMLADLAPPGRTGEALSISSLALYLGVAIGPLIGETLLDLGGFNLAWAGGAALALVAGLLALAIPETGSSMGSADASPSLVHRAAIGPGLGLLVGMGGMASFFAFVTLRARELGMDGSSLVLLVFGAVVIGCRIVFAKLPDRIAPFKLGTLALACCASGLAAISVLPGTAGLVLGASLLATGVAFTTPAFFNAVVHRVSPNERGAALGTASLFIDLGFGGGPMLLGFVAGGASLAGGFAVVAVIAVLGSVATAYVGWFKPREASPA